MEEYIHAVLKFAAYVDQQEKIIGIYATNKDCLIAQNSFSLKKLKTLYKFKIQMVIK